MSELPFDVGDEQSDPNVETLASRVLIVDDEAVVLDVMFRLLSREPDLIVVTMDSAERAIERLRAERFDVLITDKNLPGMGGLELIEHACKIRPGLEAVMITGYASAESVLTAFAVGASDYLVKPFDDLRMVRAKIRAALDRKNERRRVREEAHVMARDAKQLLDRGRDAPEADWQQLESAFKRYEQTILTGVTGDVAVVGGERAAQMLNAAEIHARSASANDPSLDRADVVVLETSDPSWRVLADKLVAQDGDVVLLAGESADLSDLLEAIALRLELVGYEGKNSVVLGDRVRAILMRRSVQRAQAELNTAIHAFRRALAAAG